MAQQTSRDIGPAGGCGERKYGGPVGRLLGRRQSLVTVQFADLYRGSHQ